MLGNSIIKLAKNQVMAEFNYYQGIIAITIQIWEPGFWVDAKLILANSQNTSPFDITVRQVTERFICTIERIFSDFGVNVQSIG
jgi:hypothetical protein